MSKETDTWKEYKRLQQQYRAVAVAAAATLTGGAVFYHFVEKLDWLDAFYFATITLTTVGYGDITPQTTEGKLFTMFYVLAGIGILATFANLFLKNSYVRRQVKKGKPYEHDK